MDQLCEGCKKNKREADMFFLILVLVLLINLFQALQKWDTKEPTYPKPEKIASVPYNMNRSGDFELPHLVNR